MANADKGSIEFIRGSIGDLIFRIETLSSDRDTIKLCVRAAQELAWLESQLTKRALDGATPCAHRFHAEDEKDSICIDCGARTPRQ